MKKLYTFLILLFTSIQGFSQFYEGFEGDTFPPAGWMVTDNGVGMDESWVRNPAFPNNGNWSAYMDRENIGAGNTSQDWLISPQLYLGSNSLLKFSSRTSLAGNQGTIYQIRFSTSAIQSDLSSYTVLQTYTENDLNTIYSNYEEKTIDLSALSGQSVYIAFVMIYTQPTNALGGDRWYLDDINISEPLEIILNAFLDLNNNAVKESNEPNFPHGSFNYQINSGNTINADGSNGNHSIFVSNTTNSYNLNYSIFPGFESYFTTSTSYSNISISSGSTNNIYYFPITNLQILTDLQIDIIGNNLPPRPGFTYTNILVYRNNGSQAIPAGTITFTKNPVVTITNISQGGTIATTTGFTYEFTNLVPFETRYIYVTMQVPTIPIVNLGDVLTNSVTITPSPDTITSNNESSISQVVVGAYDPNDKMENHGPTININYFNSNDYLYYTIRFENIGTASAEFIRIEDALHEDLDPTTFQMIHASHPYDVTRIGNQLEWFFNDINLPPTSQDPNLSRGYVHFKIKPNPGFVVGDIIPNTAEIYFDYNPAIITNTFETEFVTVLSVSDYDSFQVAVYPNPTNEFVHIQLEKSTDVLQSIVVYDLLGKQVLSKTNLSRNSENLDISKFKSGTYLLEITTQTNLKTTKKLVIR